MDDPSRPLQSGTSDELARSKSPPRFRRKLAPVAESESSNFVAIGLDRPFSDDVQANISSSSSTDEGHLNVLTESEVGTRSSESKDPQVEQVVVMGVCDPQAAPPDSEVTFKPPTTGTLLSASSHRPDPQTNAAPGSVDMLARPEEASQGRLYKSVPKFIDCLRTNKMAICQRNKACISQTKQNS